MIFSKVSIEQFAQDMYTSSDPCPQSVGYSNYLLYFKSLSLPHRATHNSAGYDFYMPFKTDIKPHDKVTIPTGISWHPTKNNQVLKIYPRSSLGCKYGIALANTMGIIDADYCQSDNEGHILVTLVNNSDKIVSLNQGDKFIQGIISEYISEPSYDNLFEINNRNGGFGSTN